jgi:polyisoprenoid-binding protein YceI
MKKVTMTVLALFTSVIVGADIGLEPASKLWLIGDSTLHAFSSTATELDFQMKVDGTGTTFEKIQKGGMKSLVVNVPVTKLKSEKAGLDKNMYKSLKAETNPTISFTLSEYTVNSSTMVNSCNLAAKGNLSIAGQTKPVEIDVVVTDGKPVNIKGSEEVLMTDYGIKPPSMFGAIRTHNRIVVNFDLFLKD